MNTKATHPALLRTTAAIADIGARQGARSLPVMALVVAVLALQIGAIAAIGLN
jgi:hypothetical protein